MTVLGELETLQLVAQGRSLARFGDGEFNLCLGGRCKSQQADPALRARLLGILQASGDCLVGLPYADPASPKYSHWAGRVPRYRPLLANRPYGSAFVSRPDSAPWINTAAYWSLLESLWLGRDVTLVRGASKSLTADVLMGAGEITEIAAPRSNAWGAYDDLLERIGTPARAILCLGPTATVLAVDLCARGVHAIDLGHVGLFYRKWRAGEEMALTDADRWVEC